MEKEKIQGYSDQELLVSALSRFISAHIKRSEQIVRGLIRQSIAEWAENNKSSLKEIKKSDENGRLLIIMAIIDIFMEKIKHIVTSKIQRDRLKQNALQIYEQWKKTRRTDSAEELKTEISQMLEQK